MHDDSAFIEQRVRRAMGRLRPAVHSRRIPLVVGRGPVTAEPIPVPDALAAGYRPATVGEAWGPPWSTTWFRLTGSVPAEWAGRRVEALIDLGFDPARTGFQCEGLAYRRNGSPVKGVHPRSQWAPVSGSAAAGEPVELFVEAVANPDIQPDGVNYWPTPLGDTRTAGADPLYVLRAADLAVFDATVWELVQDLEVLAQLAGELPASDARRRQLLAALDRSLDLLDVEDVPGTAAAAREPLQRRWRCRGGRARTG